MMEITPEEVKTRLDAGEPLHLIDVREAQELAICAIADAEHIPMRSLFLGHTKTAAERGNPIVVICHHGVRSLQATIFLRRQGFEDVQSMAGGVDAWADRIDPEMSKY